MWAHHPRVSNNLLGAGREEGERENGTGQSRSGGRSVAAELRIKERVKIDFTLDCATHIYGDGTGEQPERLKVCTKRLESSWLRMELLLC
ncbi:hypothetical protein ANANG_G00229820 [Anguilla anguilla]|uniref:Uncharacterized protein n=1 Tax=Anguilla anguilla TaxID=7936 RepID=A0A9D3LXS0_ANGAN|nr:hypothetical protein ANANG_G00229820 [Anguilla anguilla]